MEHHKEKSGYIGAERSGAPHHVVLHPKHMQDQALWQAFKAGDEKALITIFDRFTASMFNYAFKITSDRELVKDCIQDLFIEIWRNRERLGDTDSIKYYLFKSIRRKLIRMESRTGYRLFARWNREDGEEYVPSAEFIMISEQVSEEKKQKLQALLATLSPRQHEVIFLRYFEELSCDQIAEVMGLRKQGVYNLIHQAMASLRVSAGDCRL